VIAKGKEMLKRKALPVAVLCAVFSLCPLLYSQANGSLSGTVTDKTGSVISAATVKITSQGTGLAREVRTDGSGHYTAPFLPVAFYTIRVESQGFRTTEQKDIRLQIDEHLEIDFTLNPASVTSTVEVSATEVAVETANPTLGQVITSEQVADLPLNGRSFVQLATLTPGTTQSTSPISFFTSAASSEAATRGAFSLSVGGSREQSTDWLLDGNDNNQLDEGGIAIFSEIDGIQEFKVLTYNYSAEYGERAGPTVLVTTKSGSNQFHGTAFEFFRNTILDAKVPFANTTPKFNLNQFGGSFGGPIQKNKTFFFADYQAKRQRKGVLFTGLVPTQPMMNDDFTLDPLGLARPGTFDGTKNTNGFSDLYNPYAGNAPFQCVPGTFTPEPVNTTNGTQTSGTPCNVIPQAIINPTNLVNSKGQPEGLGQALVNLYPVANVTGASGYNYTLVPVRRLNQGTGDIRLDHIFSSHDSAFGRFSYDQANSLVPGGSPGFAEQNPFGSTQNISNHGRNAMLSEQHVFSSTMINQVGFGFNRIFNHILSFGTGTCEATNLLGPGVGIPGANLDTKCNAPGVPAGLDQSKKECVSCGLTSNQLTGYYSVGDRAYAPYLGGTNVWSAWDTLDLIRGKHDIRVGLTYRANQMNVLTNAYQDGYNFYGGGATGDSLADLLLGEYSFAAHDQTFLGAETGRRWKLFRPFVQDDWRVTPDLTVNIGLAWALVTPETEVANRQSNFDLPTGKFYLPNGSIESGCSICVASDGRAGIQFDKTALEPRIGLAWKVFGKQSTVLRAGYAIYHDSAWNQGGQGLWQNWPFFFESDQFGPCSSYATAASGGCTLAAGYPVVATPQPIDLYAGTIQSQNRKFKQGTIQQYNLNVERQLPANVVLTIGYAGTRSTHVLVSQVNENIASPAACGVVSGYTLGCGITSLPFPNGFNANVVNSNNSIGSARYDSLQVKAETKSVRHGLYALLGYTWSRNFDSGMPDGLGTNVGGLYWPLPGTKKLDWGLSQLDLNDTFTASVLYDLPFGKGKAFGSSWSGPVNAIFGNWETDVIVKATSGFPLFVVDSNNGNAFTTFGCTPGSALPAKCAGISGTFLPYSYNFLSVNRPNEVGDPNKPGPVAANPGCNAPSKVHTITAWFNPCAFMQVPYGELGTAARAPIYSPRFVNADLSLIKNIPISFREGMSLQFRAELFNVFNHPNYYLIGFAGVGEQDISTPSTFGAITQTLSDSRVAQFALKLKF
jgi:hypothetical protein